MENQLPTPQEFEAYQKVNAYLERNIVKTDNQRFSFFLKPQWLWAIILAVVAFLCYYGSTTLLFGEEFWIRSIIGSRIK